ncbi:hypothetical protein AB6806_02940 [Bosea sp. RCC_152_1]|uniref:hypothetical protein n=1 Tax=Bosea sp. RCC_152_1 TaxID=3239228 RepID=UPI0035236BB9
MSMQTQAAGANRGSAQMPEEFLREAAPALRLNHSASAKFIVFKSGNRRSAQERTSGTPQRHDREQAGFITPL